MLTLAYIGLDVFLSLLWVLQGKEAKLACLFMFMSVKYSVIMWHRVNALQDAIQSKINRISEKNL